MPHYSWVQKVPEPFGGVIGAYRFWHFFDSSDLIRSPIHQFSILNFETYLLSHHLTRRSIILIKHDKVITCSATISFGDLNGESSKFVKPNFSAIYTRTGDWDFQILHTIFCRSFCFLSFLYNYQYVDY